MPTCDSLKVVKKLGLLMVNAIFEFDYFCLEKI